jgi:hypothetical protein
MLAKLDAKHLDTLARIDLRTGSTDIDTHFTGTRFGTEIDTHSIAYEKVGYKHARRLVPCSARIQWMRSDRRSIAGRERSDFGGE